MRKPALVAALLALFAGPGSARATFWLGEPDTTGPVDVPALYTEATASLIVQRATFDALLPGTEVAWSDLGGFRLTPGPGDTTLRAASGIVAGTEPASAPIALLVGGTPDAGGGLQVRIDMVEPVAAFGFVLMGLDNPAQLDVYDDQGTFRTVHSISAGSVGQRRWVGVVEQDWLIGRIVLTSTLARPYALDDVELGVHAPEPASLVLWLWSVALMGARPTSRQIEER